jgi:hypothetical protein
MLAHESQFSAAYSRILLRAQEDLGEGATFFRVHSLADIEHASSGESLLADALQKQVIDEESVRVSYEESTAILRDLADQVVEAL